MRLSRALQPQDKKKKLIHLDGIHKKIYNESKQPHRYFNYSSVTELYLKDKNLKSRKLSIRLHSKDNFRCIYSRFSRDIYMAFHSLQQKKRNSLCLLRILLMWKLEEKVEKCKGNFVIVWGEKPVNAC